MHPDNEILVLYHANCPDGFTAAWVMWKKFGNKADYRAVNYGQPVPSDVPLYKKVIVVDFSYPREAMIEMAAQTELVVLDHHKTAEENLRGLPFATFDMDRSGAHMAWDWAFPNLPCPGLVVYVEDRDLWRWAFPNSREVSQWLRGFEQTFPEWQRACDEFTINPAAAFEIGAHLLRFQNTQVDIMARRAVLRTVLGYQIPVANATCFFSEVGERMCELHPDAPCALYYFDREEGIRQWGLRSRGGFDCTIIAKAFGGGGHPGAAGFTTKVGFDLSSGKE